MSGRGHLKRTHYDGLWSIPIDYVQLHSRIAALEAENAELRRELRWLFDNYAELVSPTEDYGDWCAELKDRAAPSPDAKEA